METIINVENRLRAIKSIFELMIQAETFSVFVHIDDLYNEWERVNFRAECLAIPLNDERNKKTINVIRDLADDCRRLYRKALRYQNEAVDCRIICKVAGGQLMRATFTREVGDNPKEQFFDDSGWMIYKEGKFVKQSEQTKRQAKIFLQSMYKMFDSDSFYLFAQQVSEFINNRVMLADDKPQATKMDLDLLDELFIPNMTQGEAPTKLERLKTDLRANVITYNGKQITALADLIYSGGALHKAVKPKNFSVWLKQFCNIVGLQTPTSKQNAVTTEREELKRTYYYFIP